MTLELVIGAGLLVVFGASLAWLRRVNPGLRWLPGRVRHSDIPLKCDDALFKQLAEGMQAVFWLAAPDLSRIYYVSPFYETMTGHSVAELYADPTSWQAALRPAESQEIHERHQPPDPNRVFEGEFPFVRADGSTGWSRVRIQPVYDEREVLVGRLGMITDMTEHKRLENALQASERNYRNVVERASDGILIIQDEIVKYCNPQLARLLGYNVEQIEGQSFDQMLPPDLREAGLVRHRRRMEGQPEPDHYETNLQHLDGHPVEIEITVVETEYDGRPAFLGFIHDLTKRKRVEIALLRSEERYRSLFEDSPVGLWEEDFSAVKARLDELRRQGIDDFRAYFESDPDAVLHCIRQVKVMDVNRATLRMTRAIDKHEVMSGMALEQPPGALALMREQLIAVSEGRLSFSSEGVGLTVEGDVFDILLTWSVVSGYEDTLSKVIVSMQDITPQKEAENALRRAEVRSEAILSALPDLMYRANRDGTFLDVRGVANLSVPLDAVQYARQYVGRTLQDIMPQAQADLILTHIRQALDTGEMQFVEYRLPTDEGERDYEVRIVASDSDEVVSVVRDITQRKRAEAERERLIVELNAFGRTVAHDLKTPLTAIMGYTEMLTDDFRTLSEGEIREFLWIIANDTEKMSRIIDELMLLASVRELDAIHMRPLDMGLIVTGALGRLSYMIKERDARVALPLAKWPIARGYAPWIEEVWANYLSNAIKYGGDPLTIEIGADPPQGGMVRFWVHDNGPGIAQEDQKLLFTEFTRLDALRAQGHGLGLSIVLRIVEKLCGTVDVQSAPGEGSTFGFSLPAASDG